MSAVAIHACGMTTAIGLTAPAAAAAQRARLSRFEETHFISSSGEFMIGAEVPLDPPRRGRARLAALLAGPLRECFAACPDVAPDTIPVLLCLAEKDRPGRLAGLETLLHEALQSIGVVPHPSCGVISYGRVSGLVALRDARKLIEAGAPRVVIAGADSFLIAGTLAAFDAEDRVLTAANSNGFPAGEAGAAVLVGPPGGDGLRLEGIGFGTEAAHILSGEPLRADGLSTAIRGALAEAGRDFAEVDYRIADLNGEQYYFKEAALAMQRIMRTKRDAMDLWTPASEYGATGAASFPLMLGTALMAARKAYAPGPVVLLQTSDDDGRRGAAIFRTEG